MQATVTVEVLKCEMVSLCRSLRPRSPKHHLTPALSPTSWRRGRRKALGFSSNSRIRDHLYKAKWFRFSRLAGFWSYRFGHFCGIDSIDGANRQSYYSTAWEGM